MTTIPEAFVPLNGSANNSAPVVTGVTGGRRHRGSKKHLKLVTRKQARTILRKMGKKMRGGDDNAPGAVVSGTSGTPPPPPPKAEDGGRRRRHGGTKKTHRKSHKGRSLFGMKY